MRAMRSRLARGAIAVCVAAVLGWISAISLAAEGGSALDAGVLHMAGSAVVPRTNPGGKYTLDYGSEFHTNPGGKYVYRGQSSKFHTNPGGKYVYPGYSAAPR
jgi:hypothetical protein